MNRGRPRSFRCPDALWRMAGRTAGEHLGPGGALSVSDYVRSVVADDVASQRDGPYTCIRSRSLCLVDASGCFHFWRFDDLRLNRDVASVRAKISMKHSKIEAWLDEADDATPFLEARWIATRFALRDPPTASRAPTRRGPEHPDAAWTEGGPVLEDVVQVAGITSKKAVLPCPRPKGSVVRRELGVVLDDYAQWYRPSGETRDAVEIDVLVPTHDIEVLVVLDKELYGGGCRLGPFYNPQLRFELQTLEGLPLPPVPWGAPVRFAGEWPRPGSQRDPLHDEATAAIHLATARAAAFLDRPVPLPEACAFVRLQLRRANVGSRLAVLFDKPDRRPPPTRDR